MARRRSRTSAIGGNMDSMLDTLTNVVGILIIVLVTVQLSSQEAASRIAEAMEKFDPREIALIEKAAFETKAEADRLEEALKQLRQPGTTSSAAEAAKLEAQAAKAEAAAREMAAKAAAVEKAKTEQSQAAAAAAKKAAEDRATAEAAVKKAEQARLALAAELKNTQLPATPPAKKVRLPDPRPAPKDARELRVLCREGRVWTVDMPALQSQAQKRAAFIINRKQLDADGDHWLTPADAKVLETEFNKLPVRADDFKMTLSIQGTWLAMVLERKPQSGELPDTATKTAGSLARMLKQSSPSDAYVRFYVWPDAFEAYLAARQFVGEQGFAAGWEVVGSQDESRMSLGKYAIGTKPKEPQQPSQPQNVID